MSEQLLPHQQRVVDEKNELDVKLSKLTTFLESDMFKNLSDIDRNLLEKQASIMSSYSMVLNERINIFKGK